MSKRLGNVYEKNMAVMDTRIMHGYHWEGVIIERWYH